MAGAVNTEGIDLILKDAQICNAQLNILHNNLERLIEDENISEEQREEWRRAIEARSATIFRDMMSNLYSVLDQIYYFLYCHFQNNGNASFRNAAFQIKQPTKQDLKWSENENRDQQPDCKPRRNQWVQNQCNVIFGDNYPNNNLQSFQNDLLGLQAIRKVNSDGAEVPAPHGGPTLVRAFKIQHDPAADALQFNPQHITFEELKSVKNLDAWNDTIIFNLLHFFRNFTAHRSLIACEVKDGYLNLETREFKPGMQNVWPWIHIAAGVWIEVPELSHLRQAGRIDPPTFYLHPLLIVCSKVLDFVKLQRHNMLNVVDGVEGYPYEISSDLQGHIVIKKDGIELGVCEWSQARLWPVYIPLNAGINVFST